MQNVKIETAQNVDIHYETASVGDRIVATIFDYIIFIGYFIALAILASYIADYLGDDIVPLYMLASLPLIFYDLICEVFMDGQSFGKKLKKIKVVKIDGTQPTLGSYLLRWVLRIIDTGMSTGAVAVLTILLHGKGQRIGDIAAGTTVINLKRKVSLDDTIFMHLEDNYQPTFPAAEHLETRVIAIIKEVLDFDRTNRNSKSSSKILEKTRDNVMNKMGVTSIMQPKDFLVTVLKDYNYYQGKV